MNKKNLFENSKILVDYLAFSVALSDLFEDADPDDPNLCYRLEDCFSLGVFNQIPGEKEGEFIEERVSYQDKRGFYGYKYSRWYNGIVYCWGNQSHVYVQLSGSGCRTFEILNPGIVWEQWLDELRSTLVSFHLARLDVAFDTFGALKLPIIISATQRQKFISRWNTYLVNDGNREQSVIWGSSKSDCRFRIYDKTLERSKALRSSEEVPRDWVRLEFQFRNKMAAAFLREWLACKDLSFTYFGVLRQKLLYVQSYDGIHSDRAVVYPWWSRLIEDYPRIKLACRVGAEYNLQNLESYVYDQAGSSIKALLKAREGDLSLFLEKISEKSLNDRQIDLLQRLKLAALDAQPVVAAPAPALPVKYSCSVCGFSGFESDFVIYGSDSECVCRSCATSGRMDRQQLLDQMRAEALRGAEHTDLF